MMFKVSAIRAVCSALFFLAISANADFNEDMHPDFARKLADIENYEFFPEDSFTQSICGTDDKQDVNHYDGRLGQTKDYVKKYQPAVGAMAETNDPTKSDKFCSGTLIGVDLFLTASHCLDAHSIGQYIAFNYERAPNSRALLKQDFYKIVEKVEDGAQFRLDYAILRLQGQPGMKYGWTGLDINGPATGDLITIIQHPRGLPKQVEVGKVSTATLRRVYYGDLDTEGGSSGSGVLSAEGKVIGVHTNGGCYRSGGNNYGTNLKVAAQNSSLLREIANSEN